MTFKSEREVQIGSQTPSPVFTIYLGNICYVFQYSCGGCICVFPGEVVLVLYNGLWVSLWSLLWTVIFVPWWICFIGAFAVGIFLLVMNMCACCIVTLCAKSFHAVNSTLTYFSSTVRRYYLRFRTP